MRHTVVVSDVHLWDGLPGDGLWMRYRQRRFFPDEALGDMLRQVHARAGKDPLEVVFNGDIFDFDVAPVRGDQLDHSVQITDEAGAVERMAAILDDHAVFLRTVSELVASGQRVVFVAGNHDVPMHWPGVRALLADRIVRAASPCAASEGEMRSRIEFRGWFHRTEDGIHIEHGNQYDRYCAFDMPLTPFVDDGKRVQMTVGSLVMHHVIGKLGYFNPNLDSSFLLSASGYARHFFRHYAFSRESLVGTWALGTMRVAWKMLRGRNPLPREVHDAAIEQWAARTGLDPDALRAHLALARPAGVHEFLRTLHLDKAALAAVVVAAAALTAARPRAALGFAVGSVGVLAAFQIAVPEEPLSQTYRHVRQCQQKIASLYGARAVVFGHTHEAYGSWERGVFFGNCGTWSPRFHDVECTRPYEPARPFIWLRYDETASLRGGLYRYEDGRIEPAEREHRATHEPPPPAHALESGRLSDPAPVLAAE